MKDVFASAAILAGGKSSRMGFDKQLLTVQRKSLQQLTIARLRRHFPDIIMVTNTPELYQGMDSVRTCSDIYPGLGPLGGIHAALHAARSQYVYVIACDMPCINHEYIEYMRHQLMRTDKQACVTQRGNWYEPFNAFYSTASLPVMENDLSEGKSSMFYFLKKIDILAIEEAQAQKFSPDMSMFVNLNTREDYENYLSMERSV